VTTPPPFAQVLVRNAPLDAVADALDAVMAREGYAPFDPSKLPAGYPEERGEFARVAVAGPDAAGAVTLVLADWDRAFARSLAISKRLPAATVVAIVRPPADPVRLKAYRGGDVALKAGDDPDDELFYNPPPSDRDAASAFLASWGGVTAPCVGAGADHAPAPDVIAALGVARADVAHPDAVAGRWPVPLAPRLYASTRSRLYLES
jgi:hypothetical protein